MIMTKMEANITIVPIFTLTFIMLYYIRRNAYKVYKIKEISEEETKKIEEEKKWVRNKSKLALITIFKLLATGIILFLIR